MRRPRPHRHRRHRPRAEAAGFPDVEGHRSPELTDAVRKPESCAPCYRFGPEKGPLSSGRSSGPRLFVALVSLLLAPGCVFDLDEVERPGDGGADRPMDVG